MVFRREEMGACLSLGTKNNKIKRYHTSFVRLIMKTLIMITRPEEHLKDRENVSVILYLISCFQSHF